MHRTNRSVLVLLVAVGALILGACGVDAPPRSGDDPVTSLVSSTVTTADPADVSAFLEAWRQAEVDAENAAAFEAFQAAATTTTAPPTSTTTTSTTTPPAALPPAAPPVVHETGSGCVLPAYICECESGHNYSALNASSGAGGMYQFMPSTWDGVARQIAPEWVGTPPHLAPPAVQDRFAAHLWAGGAGRSHWSCA